MLFSFQFQPMVSEVYESGMCTLPRQHWPNHSVQSMTMGGMSPSVLYTSMNVVNRTCSGSAILPKDVEARIQGQCCIQSQKDTSLGTPLVMTKRESSV